MIRIRVPLRLALMAGLLAPGLALAQQESRPVEGPSAAEARTAYQAAAKAASEAEAAANVAHDRMLKAQGVRVEAFHTATGEKSPGANRPKAPTSTQFFSNPNQTQFFNTNQTRVYTPRANQGTLAKGTLRLAGSDPLEARFGLALADADDALRAQLAIPAGEGVVVITVKPEGLAGQAGLKSNDVVTALGDEPAKDVAQAKGKILAIGKGSIQLKLIREGKARQLSLVGPGHGTPDEPADYWIGTPITPVDPTLRSHVPGLAEGVGLIANDVVADSPAAKAGVKKFDILTALGKKPLKDPAGLIAAVQSAEGKPVVLEIVRAGKPLNLEVTPVRREPQTVTNVVFAPGGYQWNEALKQVNGLSQDGVQNGVATFDWSKLQPLTFQALPAPEPAKVEALLGELKGMIEDLKKQVEAIKKPDGE